jgi:tripartite-type tricarboxylate transporter receptor subunit TctC
MVHPTEGKGFLEMKHRFGNLAASIAAILASISFTGAAPAEAKDYYEGKTLTLLVGFGAGSGNTTQAHLFARHLPEFIAGHPNVIVKNMPGGGTTKAKNFLHRKGKPDGLTVVFGPVFAMNQVIQAPGVRFRYQDFTFIGGAVTAPRVMFIRKDALPGGMKKPADIMKVTDLRYAAVSPTVILSQYGRPMLDMLGLKYRYIPGHKGGGKVRNSVRSGESNIAMHGLSGYRSSVEPTQIKSGLSMPLWYFPHKNEAGEYENSPLVPDFQNYLDVYREITGKAPAGPHWKFLNLVSDLDQLHNSIIGPPKMNGAAAAALSKGYYALLADDGFQKAANKITGSRYIPRSPAFARQFFKNLAEIPDDMVAYSKKYLSVGMK